MMPVNKSRNTSDSNSNSNVARFAQAERHGSRSSALPQEVALRSFTDSLTNSNAVEEADKEKVWDLLNDTISRFGAGSRLNNDGEMSPVRAQQTEQNQSDFAALPSTGGKLPVDHVLKTSLRVSSPSSLAWCRQPSAALQGESFEDFVRGESCVDNPTRQFLSGLYYYQHPAAELQPSPYASIWQSIVPYLYRGVQPPTAGRDAARTDAITQRLNAWEAALRSLYYRYRHGKASSFVVLMNSQAAYFSRLHDDVLFVILTKSTAGERAVLHDMGVHFSAPLQSDRGSSGAVTEADRSILTFSTWKDVHGFYDFLLAHGPRLSSATDVPTLVCRRAFVGACVSTLRIHELQKVQEPNGSFIHVLELQGLLLSESVEKLIEALLYTQAGRFDATLSADERCIGFNLCEASKSEVDASMESRPFAFASLGSSETNQNVSSAATFKVVTREKLTRVLARSGQLYVEKTTSGR